MSSQPEFAGSERFEIEDRLGSGGFGVVYRAYDREKRTTVALKTLPELTADSLQRFKNEFRTLADISHPNLVSLYELVSDGDRWLFTMELIDGADALDYVFGEQLPRVIRESPTEIVSRIAAGDDEPVPRVIEKSRHLRSSEVVERLRSVLTQLVNGIAHLHGRGRLHRDIKPGNILVTRKGRLVLLDFGLAVEIHSATPDTTLQPLLGTPEYMAPEMLHSPGSAASDWYSVGTILFEALTGRLPYWGTGVTLLWRKGETAAPDPADFAESVPSDLRELCLELLERDPSGRPSEARIRAIVKQKVSKPVRLEPRLGTRLIGRDRHLAKLDGAFSVTRSKRASIVIVRGRSGMGKTLLLQHFFDDVRARFPSSIALYARCYERESVPYKALDALADGLAEVLRGFEPRENESETLQTIVPREIAALARMFPLFATFVPSDAAEVPEDPQEQRTAAFSGLRDLLHSLSHLRPVILAIDDLQWGDIDSAFFLADLFRGASPPPLLFISAYRSEDAESAPFLQTFRRTLEAGAAVRRSISRSGRLADLLAADIQQIVLDELSFNESKELALELLGNSFEDAVPIAEEIARESGGSPFFAHELARFVLSSNERPDPGVLRLEQVLSSRLRRLGEDARQVLFTVAVAGRPVTQLICRTAAGIENTYQSAVAALRAANMVRITGSRDDDLIETYHDRVRQMVVNAINGEELRALHESLAVTMEASDDDDLETIALHYKHAGNDAAAIQLTEQAAERAMAALAFDAATRLHRRLIEWSNADDRERLYSIHLALAATLVDAGRAVEAAESLSDAASLAPDEEEVTELNRRAAEQLIRSGHLDEGMGMLRSVFDEIGLAMPFSNERLLPALIMMRLQVRLRGIRFKSRAKENISRKQLTRVDATWSAAIGLGLVDPLRGALFQSRNLIEALKAGEPFRISRAIALEGAYASARGGSSRRRGARMLSEADRIAAACGEPEALALAVLLRGMSAVFAGEWMEGQRECERAETLLRTTCRGVSAEIFNARLYALLSLTWQGELAEVTKRLPLLLDDVSNRADLFAETYVRTRLSWIGHLLVEGESETAAESVREAIGKWSQHGFHTHHYHHLMAQVEIALYSGGARVGHELLREQWPMLERSMLLRVEIVNIEAHYLRARAALVAAASRRSSELLDEAEKSVSVMRRARSKWGDALAQLMSARLAVHRGDIERADSLLHDATIRLKSSNMMLHHNVARARLAELRRDAGMARVSRELLKREGIRDLDATIALYAP